MTVAAGPKHLWSFAVAALLFLSAVCNSVTAAEVADTVLVNGKILTVDKNFSVAAAIAIRGSRIVAVGSNRSIRNLAGAATRVIDLHGKTVIPGLIDNHMHFIRAAQRWDLQARIDGVNSRAGALAIISKKAASMAPGAWLMVQGGWYENQFADEPGGFTLEELDKAAPRNPLFLQVTYQTVYGNSLALQAVGVSPSTGARHDGPPLISPKPPYGLLNAQMPAVSDAQLRQNVRDYIAALNRAGLTAVYDPGRPSEGDFSLLDSMSVDGPLPLRVWHTLRYEAYDSAGADAAVELIRSTKPNTTNDYLGTLGLGEHLYLPMFDLPGVTKSFSQDVIAEWSKIAEAGAIRGFNVQEHTILDQTVSSLMGSIEEINKKVKLKPLRWTLAHVFALSDENIQRANAVGLCAAVHSVSMFRPAQEQPPIRKIQDSGMCWGLGSDASIVAPYQPFITLGWVVSGKSISGKVVIDRPVTRREALIAHTRSNAFLLFKEKDLGSLEVGKLADLVVLDRDYMSVPVDDIFNIMPVMTMVGGRVVFDAFDKSMIH